MALIIFFTMLILAGSCDMEKRKVINSNQKATEEELAKPVFERDADTYVFGFDLRSSPQEDARQYLPLLKYLERKTGYKFELRFHSKYRDVIRSLDAGDIHFAAVGAGTYIVACAEMDITPLARGLNEQGLAAYRSVIVVAPDSPIRDIRDLIGKRFAFGSEQSTQGHLIPRIILAEHGLSLGMLKSYKYTDSHLTCANEVITGSSDACGMQDTMGREFEKKGYVRIIHESRLYPSSGIVAGPHAGKDAIKAVAKALLDFQPEGRDAAGLYNWDKTEMPRGFVEARPEDYEELMIWAAKSGFIKKQRR